MSKIFRMGRTATTLLLVMLNLLLLTSPRRAVNSQYTVNKKHSYAGKRIIIT